MAIDYDLYNNGPRRRFPWVYVIGALVVGALVVLYMRSGGKDENGGAAESEPTAATPPPMPGEDAPAESGATTSAQTPSPSATSLAQATKADAEAERVLADAKSLQAAERMPEARERLLLALENPALSAAQRERVEAKLAEIDILLVTSPRQMPGKITYTVQPGDSFSRIASKHNCPELLIRKANGLESEKVMLHPGDNLRVLDHPAFAIDVSKTENWLLLTLDGKFFKRYRVGTGVFGKTPVGTFAIREKTAEPAWWRPDGKCIPFGDKENILGTRWMEIRATGETPTIRGYGIHGTWDNASLGKQSSAGCIRMRNEDVEELFILVPRGTPVTIHE